MALVHELFDTPRMCFFPNMCCLLLGLYVFNLAIFRNFQTCQGKCNVQNRNCALCMGFNKTGYGVETEEKCRRECDNVIVVDLIDQDEVKGR